MPQRALSRQFAIAVLAVLSLVSLSCSSGDLSHGSHDTPDKLPSQANPVQLSPDSLTLLDRATRLTEEAIQLHDRGRYHEALPSAKEALLLRERILQPDSPEIAESLTVLGLLLHQESQIKDARPLFERALRIRESRLPRNHPLLAESLTNLARGMYADGQFSEARPLLEQAIIIRKEQLGVTHPDLGVSLVHLSIVESQLGDLSKSRKTMEQALQILEPVEQSKPLDLAMALNYYGNILRRQGEFGEARPPLERSLAIRERILGPSHPHVARTLTRLGSLSAAMGDPKAALPLLQRALDINRQALGSQNTEVAGSLNEIGRVKQLLGDSEGARLAFEEALTIQESTIGPRHPFVAITLNSLGQIYQQGGNIEKARTFHTRALQIQEDSLGTSHPFLGETLTNLGYLEGRRNNFRAAEKYLQRSLSVREATLGSNHPDLASSLFDLARAKHALGELEAARSHYERARTILLTYGATNQSLDETSLGRILGVHVKGLHDYELLLSTVARGAPSDTGPRSAVADAFLVAEQARSWIVQAAVARAMARQTLTGTTDAADVQQLENLRRQRQSLWARLTELYGRPTAERSAQELSAVQAELDRIQRELSVLTGSIEQHAPRYAELTLPKPASLDSLGQLLRHDEALISWFTLDDRLLVWCLRAGRPTLYRETTIARSQLEQLVARLRISLLPIEDESTNQLKLPAYDVQTAHELYRLLIGPIADSLKGTRQLILVPDKTLLPIPFSALLQHDQTSSFKTLADRAISHQSPSSQEAMLYLDLPWLATSYSLTILPSAAALRLLRTTPHDTKTSADRFIGFGDPVLNGTGKTRGGAMLKTRGQRTLRDQLTALNRLPGSRDELLAVANALESSPQHSLYLDNAATESMVMELNRSGRLGRTRVIAFATHGLLAGELEGLSQPALVLTPPQVPNEFDDGLLALDDILRLHLPQTDWVILSACNTAGGDGSGDSLSGLARAFFFAGAKGLLVSQWSVDDLATKELMTQIFRRYGGMQPLPPAQALRQGMLALLEMARSQPQQAYFAHPFAWASFMLVGEGQ